MSDLTKDDILKMEASLEFDKLMAEIVMEDNLELYDDEVDDIYQISPLPYSSKIVASWRAVERLEPKFRFQIRKLSDQWEAIFVKNGSWADVYYGFAKTAPEAICKAAIIAILEQGDSNG